MAFHRPATKSSVVHVMCTCCCMRNGELQLIHGSMWFHAIHLAPGDAWRHWLTYQKWIACKHIFRGIANRWRSFGSPLFFVEGFSRPLKAPAFCGKFLGHVWAAAIGSPNSVAISCTNPDPCQIYYCCCCCCCIHVEADIATASPGSR